MRKERQTSHAKEFEIMYVEYFTPKEGNYKPHSLGVGCTWLTSFQRVQYGTG